MYTVSKNKCIGDDTKAATRQSPNCIKKTKKLNMAKTLLNTVDGILTACNVAQSWQTLISPGGSILECGMWLWNHESEFTKWQHPATWHVALGWHVIEFAQTSSILEFYFWFRFQPYHCSRHVILHHSAKFYPNRTTLGRKNDDVNFQDGRSPSWILWSNNGFFKKPTYYFL